MGFVVLVDDLHQVASKVPDLITDKTHGADDKRGHDLQPETERLAAAVRGVQGAFCAVEIPASPRLKQSKVGYPLFKRNQFGFHSAHFRRQFRYISSKIPLAVIFHSHCLSPKHPELSVTLSGSPYYWARRLPSAQSVTVNLCGGIYIKNGACSSGNGPCDVVSGSDRRA